jgi:DNA-binding MarR family transcriptional regulator
MKTTEETLVNIGLTLTEAKIYLAGLNHDTVTIADLGRQTKIKRPTIYHAISTLLEKGLVSEKKHAGKSVFSMCEPENIRSLIEQQKESIEKQSIQLEILIPLLLKQKKSNKNDGVRVVQYDGIDGMKTVMDIAFYCKSRHWDIIAPFKNFLREHDKDYAERYLNARKHHGITSRTLWEEGMRDGKKLTKDEVRERNPRLMPWVMHGKFQSMMILFDDKIAIFSSYEKLSAILITSKDLHTMFLAIFDGLWEFSEQY